MGEANLKSAVSSETGLLSGLLSGGNGGRRPGASASQGTSLHVKPLKPHTLPSHSAVVAEASALAL